MIGEKLAAEVLRQKFKKANIFRSFTKFQCQENFQLYSSMGFTQTDYFVAKLEMMHARFDYITQ